jgi:hypothetical protein
VSVSESSPPDKGQRGFIALARGIIDHPLVGFKKPYCYANAWQWLLFEAEWKPRTIAVSSRNGALTSLTLERGQLSFSLSFMAEAWGWTVKRVRTFLKLLTDNGMIEGHAKGTQTTTQKGTQQSVITICNYESYQNREVRKGTQKGTQAEAKRATTLTSNKLTKESTCAVADATRTPTVSSSKKEEKRTSEIDTAFEEFWKVKPSKGKLANPKHAAKLKFIAAIKAGTKPEAIVAAARGWAKSVSDDGTEVQFIPMAKTWLHQRRYEDAEPSATADDGWFKVLFGTPQFDAWEAYAGKLGSPDLWRQMQAAKQPGRGFTFRSEWPLGHKNYAPRSRRETGIV